MTSEHAAAPVVRIVGCILAGGRSSRMGGGDKGLIALRGRPMIAWVADRLRAETDAVLLNANGDPGRFAAFGLPVVPDGADAGEAFAGPLAGLLAALDAVAARHPEAEELVTAAADTPFVPAGFVARLADARTEPDAVVVAASDDGRHPTFALWPVGLREDLRAFLASGGRKLEAFIARHRNAQAHFPPRRAGDRLVDPFFNINRPEDLAEAETIAEALLGAAGPTGALAVRGLIDDCFRTERESLTHAEALALIDRRVAAVAERTVVPLAEALGRVLAEDVIAPLDVPFADNAAVDGYAYAAEDYAATGGFFPVVGRVAAGHPRLEPVPPGAAVRITTGAAMPAGVDTVAMQEDCETHVQESADFVIVPPGLKPGANRRRAGEDLKAGAFVMGEGSRLRPQEVASLASLGRTQATVRRRLRVGFVSTGDEVVRPGEPLRPGQVYDSNQALLAALLARAGVLATDLGVMPDRYEAVRDRLAEAAAAHDLVISTGGASEGYTDHVVAALDAIGHRALWRVAVKPGRPLTMGNIGDCAFLGLPGNPVAVFAGFLLYGLPLLARLEGARRRDPARFPLPAAFAMDKKPGRREFLRGILRTGEGGRTVVDKFGRDGSNLISGLTAADGFIDLSEDARTIRPGDIVDFVPFTGFF